VAHKVEDGSRTLQFEGTRLSHASSRRQDSGRWVEFDLYRTEAGQYVLARVGRSVVYHRKQCPLIEQYRIGAAPAATLTLDSLPCERCNPMVKDDNDVIYPEMDRPWAQVCSTADAVIRSVQRRDTQGSVYLTRVAQKLLELASVNDKEIAAKYNVQVVL
jgi:hypothetical protein